eukprot:TRINITY_DN69367_c0_g1_i1.p1 TRINITY_DN69367_c0_g1~~TRINITY_DN69367_c0_g1_i1.p1  ORF type:complete len:514 (+),score=121.76 TRINITY_DN69367_c0_g1_i1:169-1710(+)
MESDSRSGGGTSPSSTGRRASSNSNQQSVPRRAATGGGGSRSDVQQVNSRRGGLPASGGGGGGTPRGSSSSNRGVPPEQRRGGSRRTTIEPSAAPRGGGSAAVQGAGGDDGEMRSGNELYCVCRKPYDPNKFMIGCDICLDWFHAECVNVSAAEAKKIESYQCPNCKARMEEEAAAAAAEAAAKREAEEAARIAAAASRRKTQPKRTTVAQTREKKERRNAAASAIDRELHAADDRINDDGTGDPIGKAFVEDDVFQNPVYSNEDDDSDVYLTSEDDEMLEEQGDDVDRYRILRYLVMDTWDESVREELNQDWDEIFAQDEEEQRLMILRRKILKSEQHLYKLKSYEQKLQSLARYQKALVSLESYGSKALESSSPVMLVCPPEHKRNFPNVVDWAMMTKCWKCLGFVETSKLFDHLQSCIHDPVERAASSHDKNSQVCCYPLRPIGEGESNLPLEDQFCRNPQSKCLEHLGWEIAMKTQLLRDDYIHRRKISALKQYQIQLEERVKSNRRRF